MYSLFVLGAGFSKPAGLPLGNELFAEVLGLARQRDLYRVLERDIRSFLLYSSAVKKKSISEEEINFEEFISFLDIEHFLKLKGKDHWSQEGNKAQIIIRNLIALALYIRQNAMSNSDYALYEKFVENLEPDDIVVTFNYDTILENALEKKNIPYRLFPYRDKSNKIDAMESVENGEVIVFKMHGSIDWFDSSYYQLTSKIYPKIPHLIFNPNYGFFPQRMVDDNSYEDEPLSNIYRVKNLGEYFVRSNLISEVPLIISPSFSKIVYLNPLTEFWRGFNKSGIGHKRVVIIGFSLPHHDEYIKQPIYKLIHNFQNENYFELEKSKLKMIDYRPTNDEITNYKENYSFVDWERTDAYFKGLDEQVIDLIFQD